MEKLVIGCLVSCREDSVGRVLAIEPYSEDRDMVRVRYVATDHVCNYYDSSLVYLLPPKQEEREETPTLVERRKALITHLENLKGKVKKNDFDKAIVTQFCTDIQYPKKNLWFWNTVAESLTDPRKVSYAAEIHLADDDKARKFCSYAKFLRGPAKKFGVDYSNNAIDRLAFLIGSSFPNSREYRFELVSGEGLIQGYRETPENWHSCMTNSKHIHWYAVNPDKVQLVKIYEDCLYSGRALLWTTDSGEKVLDRVYPSDDGPHTAAVHAYAAQQGWDYKMSQSRVDGCLASERQDYVVTLSTKSRRWKKKEHGYPYLDTFKYTPHRPKARSNVPLSLNKLLYVFDDVDGRVEYSGPGCYECERGIDPRIIYENEKGNYYCKTCYTNRFVILAYNYDGTEIVGEYPRRKTRVCRDCNRKFLLEHMKTHSLGHVCCADCYGATK